MFCSRFSFVVLFICSISATAQVFLPGTQPEEGGIEFAKVAQCRMCHAGTKNGDADPVLSWESGMMSQAARDPVYLAALTVANQDLKGVGEYCLRCHVPRGWLEGRSKKTDGSGINDEDRNGVSCDVCHRLVDPMSAEGKKLVKNPPPGRGNAMMVADPKNVVRGPYGDGRGAMPHGTKKDAYVAKSEICATCHNVSNPVFAKDVKKQPPFAYGHLERTYSEWLLSDYAKAGKDQKQCQGCHYDQVKGGGQASRFGSPQRKHFVKHGPVGGSTWVQDAILYKWEGKGVSRKAMTMGKERAKKFLKTSASLKVSFPAKGKGTVRVTNLTGHKLPTGYIEGRRMWLNIRMLDDRGKVLKEIGKYGDKADTLSGKPVSEPTLLDPEATRIYECKPGLSKSAAAKHKKKAGPSFHFVLNDIIVKDNRIPPKGFTNAAFKKHLAQPVAYTYADGQYWDDFDFEVPKDCAKVSVRLMYQTVMWDYVKFLVEENRTDGRGKHLYEAWSKTGKCPPSVVASKDAVVQ